MPATGRGLPSARVTCPCCGSRSRGRAQATRCLKASRPWSSCRCGTRGPFRWLPGCSPRRGPPCCSRCPALARVEIIVEGETRLLTAVHDDALSVITVDGVPSTWRVAGADGGLDPALLADRPAEERPRTVLVGSLGGPGRPDRRPGRPVTGRLPTGSPRGARADANRRAAQPPGPAARVVPAQPRPAARRARPADRVPRGAGGGCLRPPAAAAARRPRPARPGAWAGRPE